MKFCSKHACLSLMLLVTGIPSYGQVTVKIASNKTEYLAGEPITVTISATNIGEEVLGYSYCDGDAELTVANGTKKTTPNLMDCWHGYGIGGGSGCGIDHPPVMHPAETTSFYYLLTGYRLRAGHYILHVKGRAGIRWYFGNGVATLA